MPTEDSKSSTTTTVQPMMTPEAAVNFLVTCCFQYDIPLMMTHEEHIKQREDAMPEGKELSTKPPLLHKFIKYFPSVNLFPTFYGASENLYRIMNDLEMKIDETKKTPFKKTMRLIGGSQAEILDLLDLKITESKTMETNTF